MGSFVVLVSIALVKAWKITEPLFHISLVDPSTMCDLIAAKNVYELEDVVHIGENAKNGAV